MKSPNQIMDALQSTDVKCRIKTSYVLEKKVTTI